MKKIWIENLSEEKNVLAAFQWRAEQSGRAEIALATSGTHQLFVGGDLIGAGPRRSAKGRSHVSRYRISLAAGQMVTVLVASYRNNSFYLVNEAPFFACEVKVGDQVYSSDAFAAHRVAAKVQKLVRYSFQRNFAECYRWAEDPARCWAEGMPGEPDPTVEVAGNQLTESDLPYAALDALLPSVIEQGALFRRSEYSRDNINHQLSEGIVFDPAEYEVDLIDELYAMGFSPDALGGDGGRDRYRLYDFAENRTGYLSLSVRAESDCQIYLIFDEILCRELADQGVHADYFAGGGLPLSFFRMGTVNAVKYELQGGREYRLLTLEPYTLRYLKVCAFGTCSVEDVCLRLYENPEAFRLAFQTSDATLQKVFRAAQNTFAQNAVDVLTDCPSRERAGWLCDSYFSAQAELLFTGRNRVERNFLACLNDFPRIPQLPEEMLPMCYPSDHDDGSFIPNWAMWYVLELEDYLRRTGDRAPVDAARERVYRLAEYFLRFGNESGMLERLDKWVFVEWSRSNDLVNDVNYPTNMLFARMCRAIGSLYGDEKYARLFETLKRTIIAESYNGSFFEDHRVRRDGKLVGDGESTETCQYYAFYMDIATPEEFPELYARMFTEFGPTRDVEKCWPEVAKSNAFIGNFLRLDYLFRRGLVAQAIDECREYFGFMADRTMTLWENDSPCASCNHGFASYAANMIVAAVTGYLGVDPVRRTVLLTRPAVKSDFSVRIPVGDDWICLSSDGCLSLPKGYRAERV